MNLLDKTFVIIIISTVTSFTTTVEIGDKPELFATDKLGNFYVYINGELLKYSHEGEKLAHFMDYSFGKIHSIDVSDPLRILLFYKESNLLLILDNKLNQLGGAIHLDQLGYFSIEAVCNSKDNAVWLYDNFNERIIKYGFSSNSETKIIHLSHFKEDTQYKSIIENNNNLFLTSQENVVWEYDLFNESLNQLEVKPLSYPQIIADKIYYHNNECLIKHEIENGRTDTIKIMNINSFEDISYSAGNYYILKSIEKN